MTITRIIKGPHRFGGFWWVVARQHLMRSTEQQARAIAVGQEAA